MDRNQAKDKITKILALVNDKATTAEEKDTALKMAEKLAEKHGLKIVKGTPKANKSGYQTFTWDDFFRKATQNVKYNTPVLSWYTFKPKNASSKFVKLLIKFVEELGMRCQPIMNGRSYSGFYYYHTKDITKTIEKLHKDCFKYCNEYKAYVKSKNGYWKGTELTDNWCEYVWEYVTSCKKCPDYESYSNEMCWQVGEHIYTMLKIAK